MKRESDEFGRREACILKWKHKTLFSVLLLQHPNAARSFNPTIETDEKLVWIYGNHHWIIKFVNRYTSFWKSVESVFSFRIICFSRDSSILKITKKRNTIWRSLSSTFLEKSPAAKGLRFAELISLAFERLLREVFSSRTRVYRPGGGGVNQPLVARAGPWSGATFYDGLGPA